MTTTPPIAASNLRLIGGNGIVALVDLSVIAWRITLGRCIWRRNGNAERIELPCDCIYWHSHGDRRRFQDTALAAVYKLANEMMEAPTQ